MESYQITLHAYRPYDHDGMVKGSYLGGVVSISGCKDLDEAIEKARVLWKENYKGAVKQIRIFKDSGKPGVPVFESDNFKELNATLPL